MAVIISDSTNTSYDGYLSTANGFYRVEADNLCPYGNLLALTTTRYIAFTPANAGNLKGVVLCLNTTSITNRQVVVTLQQNSGGWGDVAGASVTLEVDDISGDALTIGDYADRGEYFTPCVLPTPIAVTAVADTWRWKIAHGTGTGTWNIRTSDNTNPFHATWCDNKVSFSSGNDVLVVKNKLYIDQTATITSKLGTAAAAYGMSCIICSNITTPEPDTVALLEWIETPTAAYTLTVAGIISFKCWGGMRIGRENVSKGVATITIAAPGVVTNTGHGLSNAQRVKFSTTGALPTGLAANTNYYVVNKTDNTFELESTIGGGSITTTGTQSGVHTLTHVRRIPVAQKATLTFIAGAVGTTTGCFMTSSSSYTQGAMRGSLFFYGEIPTYQYTTIKTLCVTGQKDVICDDSVDWVNGDALVIGKQNTTGTGVVTIPHNTIDSVAGDTITLNENVITYNRLVGGTVIRLSGHGIKIENNDTYSTNYVYNIANIQFSGCDFKDQYYQSNGVSYYTYLADSYNKAGLLEQYLFEDCTIWSSSTETYFSQLCITPKGAKFNRCYTYRQGETTACTSFFRSPHFSGRLEITNCRNVSHMGGNVSIDSNMNTTITDNVYENGSTGTGCLNLAGKKLVFKNNVFWGYPATETYGATVYVRALFNPTEISNNTYDKCTVAIMFSDQVTIGCIDNASIFGSEAANVKDISFYTSGGMPDYVFLSPVGDLIIDETEIPYMVEGGKLGFTNFNSVAYDDRTYYCYGKIQRDIVTVHTVSGHSMRIEPTDSLNVFTYEFDVPTGNIQTKTMTVACWCKIGNANYWAGTNQLPRLNVTYDITTVTYCQASETTDWQLLFITFMPTTTTGKIIVSISGLTDATGSDRYFYIDDFSILYPAGYKLDLGSLDIWDNALPVVPPIATVITDASTIWNAQLSDFNFIGTFGDYIAKNVLTTGKFLALK